MRFYALAFAASAAVLGACGGGEKGAREGSRPEGRGHDLSPLAPLPPGSFWAGGTKVSGGGAALYGVFFFSIRLSALSHL